MLVGESGVSSVATSLYRRCTASLLRPQLVCTGADTEVRKKQGRAARDPPQAQQKQPAEGWTGGRAFGSLKYSSNLFLAASRLNEHCGYQGKNECRDLFSKLSWA